MPEQQTTSNVLMIRPVSFRANTQTAASNRFQLVGGSIANPQLHAVGEFDALVGALRSAGVGVHVYEDSPAPETPDALFPNNWVSFHSDGCTVLYPMLAPNRRLERRLEILESLHRDAGFESRELIDLTYREANQEYLEGTGSLVLDRANHIAYASLSPRTHQNTLQEFAKRLNYRLVSFKAVDRDGYSVYHTNVLMSVGDRFAVLCEEAVHSDDRQYVLENLIATGHEVIRISFDQMHHFAGNILELATKRGGSVIALSERAANAFSSDQRLQLETLSGPLVSVPIPTIETLGGGSVRCMLAEIHLPRAAKF